MITSWQQPGFRSDICSACGSPVPNPLRNTTKTWVPAGYLNRMPIARLQISTLAQRHTGTPPTAGMVHDELPDRKCSERASQRVNPNPHLKYANDARLVTSTRVSRTGRMLARPQCPALGCNSVRSPPSQ